MRPCLRLATAAAAALGLGCAWFGWDLGDPAAANTIRAGLQRRGDGLALLLQLGPARNPTVEISSPGVRLVVLESDGPRELLAPFVSVTSEGGAFTFRCAEVHAEHELSLVVSPEGPAARVEVRDEIARPSRVAELSIAYELRAPGDAPVEETFVPGGVHGDGTVAGDVIWRTPLAFARAGSAALAVLPEMPVTRPLPGALEIRLQDGRAHLRHGLVAQAVEHAGGNAICRRDPAQARALVGTTLRVQHELRLVTSAVPRATAVGLAREIFEATVAGIESGRGPIAHGSVRERCERVLAARAPRALAGSRETASVPVPAEEAEGAVELPFTTRANVALVALALAHGTDPAEVAAGRELLALATSAPHRGGLSPTRARIAGDRLSWDLAGGTYSAAATAWTRLCILRLARRLPADDPLIPEVRQRIARTVAFLLDAQRPSGAIPPRYDTTYLAPDRSAPLDPTPDSGAAALLLAEWASEGLDLADQALAAARAAVQHLARDVLPEGTWHESEGSADPTTARGRSTLALSFAALAALRVDELQPDPAARAAAAEFLDQLALVQQCWSPPWLSPDPRESGLLGGFGRHGGAAEWSDPASVLAAWAFLAGHRQTGRRDFLQRGVLALRAAVARLDAPGAGTSGLFAASGMVAAAARLVTEEFGDVVVDGAGFAEGVDTFWLPELRIRAEDIAVQLRCAGGASRPARVSFVRLEEDVPAFRIEANGSPVGLFPTPELARGIEIDAPAVPDVSFAAPVTLQEELAFRPRLVLHAPVPPGWTGEVAVWDATSPGGPPLWRTPLAEHSANGLWHAAEEVEGLALRRRASELRIGAFLLGPGGDSLALMGGIVRPGPTTEVAFAGIDQTDCLTPGPPRLGLFGDGPRLAREVAPGEEFAWRLAVPSTTAELALDFDVAGPLRVTAGGGVVLHEGAEAPRPLRRVSLRLADRRLWEPGWLDLWIDNPAPAEGPILSAAAVHTRATGMASTTAVADPGLQPREPARSIELLVLPLAFADAPLAATRDQLAAAFFGEGYLRTPPPQPRVTAGSVRELVQAMSGGRTQLEGEVVEPVTARDVLAADLARDPGAIRPLIAATFGERLGSGEHGTRVVVVVHGGPGIGGVDGAIVAGQEPPLVLVPDLAPDRSLLPTGRALRLVLAARFGLLRRSEPDTGNLGSLALTAHGDGHLPAGPLGIDLVTLGWADQIEPPPGFAQTIFTAPVQRDRRIHRLAARLPGRGSLYIEGRAGGPGEPGLSHAGVLAYWRLPNPPLVAALDGRTARPALLRLLAAGGAIQAAFVPGAAEDLLQRARALDDRAVPSLATPEGELPFRILHLAPAPDTTAGPDAGQFALTIEDLTQLLIASEPTVTVRRPGAGEAPLPLDGLERGVGHGLWQSGLLRLETASSTLRATWPLRAAAERSLRLFAGAALEGNGQALVRIGTGDTAIASAPVDAAARSVAFTADLPRDAKDAWLEIAPVEGVPRVAVRIDRMVAAPRARADHAALREGARAQQQLMDGVFHAPVVPVRLGADGRGRHVEPVVLPAGAGMIRLVCGLAFAAPPATAVRLDVSVRSLDGRAWHHALLRGYELRRGEGPQPLLVALLELPAGQPRRTGLLDILVGGPPGTELWLVTAEVARP